MKKLNNKKFQLEKLEVAKLNNQHLIKGGSIIGQIVIGGGGDEPTLTVHQTVSTNDCR